MKYEYKLMMLSVTNIADICSKLHWKIHDHRAAERWSTEDAGFIRLVGRSYLWSVTGAATHLLIIHLIAITLSSASCGFYEQLICFKQREICSASSSKTGVCVSVKETAIFEEHKMGCKHFKYCNYFNMHTEVLPGGSNDALQISLCLKQMSCSQNSQGKSETGFLMRNTPFVLPNWFLSSSPKINTTKKTLNIHGNTDKLPCRFLESKKI